MIEISSPEPFLVIAVLKEHNIKLIGKNANYYDYRSLKG